MLKNAFQYIKKAVAVTLSAVMCMSVFASCADTGEYITEIEATNLESAVQAASSVPAGPIVDPDAEIRGVWIATVANINYPSKKDLTEAELKAELDDIVSTAKAANLNAIYFQVRPTADALYNSSIFPTSKYLTGTNGKSAPNNFDPLAYLCEKAHAQGILVHAWVNPLRVTAGSQAYPETDVNALSEKSPARQHPDWVIAYDDGKLYFDAGIPEVRQLVADGVAEIVKNYPVDGIIFDDYFYPYPVNVTADGKTITAQFNDKATFDKYGGAFSNIGDWRRDNINHMMESCYKAIKEVNANCKFGAAPFGIWQNNNGSNGGSDTSGLESYNSLYCDTLAWVKGGYIDYISPQIYWRFSTSVARFDVLTRWWNKQLEGTGVDMIISHGVYRYDEWENVSNELKNQVEYARSELAYKGSIMYGYAQIKANTQGLSDELIDVFSHEIYYSEPSANGLDVSVSTPPAGKVISGETTYLIGMSDPSYTLKVNGETVGRTKGGYFSLYVNLQKGENKFVFEQNGQIYNYIVYRDYKPSDATPVSGSGSSANQANSGSTGSNSSSLSSFKIESPAPSYDIMQAPGTVVSLSCTAPAGSTVTATIGKTTVTLTQSTNQNIKTGLTAAKYTGSYTLPSASEGQIVDLGKIQYKAERGSESTSAEGIRLRSAGKNAFVTVKTTSNDAELKLGLDTWYYDDFSVQVKGMTDQAVWQGNGFYLLRVGGYVYESSVIETPDVKSIPIASVSSAEVVNSGTNTEIKIKIDQNIPHNGTVNNGDFVLTLYNVDPKTAKELKISDNPIIQSAKIESSTKANCYRYRCKLYSDENFYGFEMRYENGYAIISLKNPTTIDRTADKPLAGKKIILDAGHGGTDTGALGAHRTASGNFDEADMNLAIVLKLEEKLKSLGAEVLLTRKEDTTVGIYTRLDYLIEQNPDLVISVHQNSMPYSSDITKIRGSVALYWSDSSKLLAKTVSATLANSLNRTERQYATQRLAMCRNPKFPSVLVEVGFITNVEEYELMKNGNGIERAVEGLTEGVLKYYEAQAKYVK